MSGRQPSAGPGSRWQEADRRVLAKLIGELAYEGALAPERMAGRGPGGAYRLRLASGAQYDFTARRTIWGMLEVEPRSVIRRDPHGERPGDCAGFVIDAQSELGLGDITAAHLLEELQNTMAAEAEQRRRLEATSARDMAELSGVDLDALLDAHPKAVGNRGRIGWGYSELQAYAPEFAPRFSLRWIAVRRDRARVALAPGVEATDLVAASMDDHGLRALEERAEASDIDIRDHALVPVHPWQWSRYIVAQYASLIAAGDIVDLGPLGDRYAPQQSIRTLSNTDRPGRYDIKVSLSILNTSCYRGIPAEYVENGPALSAWVHELATTDEVLAPRGVVVLRDRGGVHCPHPAYRRIAGAPYRYREMLGAVWREAAMGPVSGPGLVVPAAALFQCDGQGRALIAEYIERSGLAVEAWASALFDRTVVPLYHLMCRYGLGIIAHGQNIGVVLDAYRPRGMVLKDFHGDVRLVDEGVEELAAVPPAAARALPRRPSRQIFHDLFTGHFVTVLRFVSSVMARELGYPEQRFYATLARVIDAYQQNHPEWTSRFATFDLFVPQVERICINRARFRIGYGDSDERPLPDLGEPLANPLAMARAIKE